MDVKGSRFILDDYEIKIEFLFYSVNLSLEAVKMRGFALLVGPEFPPSGLCVTSQSFSLGAVEEAFDQRVSLRRKQMEGEEFSVGRGCPAISRTHLRITWEGSIRKWQCQVLGKTGALINSGFYENACRAVFLSSGDLIQIPCSQPGHSHLTRFLLPKGSASDEPQIDALRVYLSRNHRVWSKSEREKFMKGCLAFGHCRPKRLREFAALHTRTIEEVFEFALSFFYRTLESMLPEEVEERQYVTRVLAIEDKEVLLDPEGEERPREPSLYDWKKMEKNAGSWVRRVRNLHYLHEIMYLSQETGADLLADVPADVIHTKKPADSWTPRDDVNLLKGVHKHGYSNFEEMFQDPELEFTVKLEDGPSSEKLNKRVKKLLDSGRENYSNSSRKEVKAGVSFFDSKTGNPTFNQQVLTYGLYPSVPYKKFIADQEVSESDKEAFLEVLMSFGLRRTADESIDWDFLRSQSSGLEKKSNSTLAVSLNSFPGS
jgi:hypothetical protein